MAQSEITALQLPDPKTRSRTASDPHIAGWRIERPLASGAQADVFRVHRARDPGRRPFVAKVFRLRAPDGVAYPAAEQRWRCCREVAALRSLAAAGCPGIVEVVESGIAPGPGARPWWIMPLYAGGPMRRPCRPGEPLRFAEDFRGQIGRVLEIAETLATTLEFMHRHEPHCVHRDLNTGNVLFRKPGGAPVLADFGIAHLASFPDRPHDAQALSSPWIWRPPELDTDGDSAASTAADVFMLGGLIFEALSGGRYLPPGRDWNGAFPHEQPEHSLRREVTDTRIGGIEELLRAMFAPDPRERPIAARIASRCRELRAGGN